MVVFVVTLIIFLLALGSKITTDLEAMLSAGFSKMKLVQLCTVTSGSPLGFEYSPHHEVIVQYSEKITSHHYSAGSKESITVLTIVVL